MTDYFTLDNDDATRYPESMQNENEFRTVIDAEVVDADEILDDAPGLDAPEPIRLIDEPMEDDTDEVDDNPVAALADTFPERVQRGRGPQKDRGTQGQAPARPRSPIRPHPSRPDCVRGTHLGRARLPGRHAGMGSVLQGPFHLRPDPCDRAGAHRPDPRIRSEQDQQPRHRRTARSPSLDG